MDTSWIHLSRVHPAYKDGVIKFIELAKENLIEGKTWCPCKKCKLQKWFSLDEVEDHILFKGFFVDEANIKVQEILSTSASSVSMNEVENEVFQQLMHGNKIPKRPIGYGLGVKASAVYGVQGLLCSGNSSEIQDNHFNIGFGTLMKQNEEMRKKNASLEAKFDQNQRLLLLVLAELKNMKDGPRGLDVDQPNSLQRSSQVPDASSKYSFHK